MPRELLKSALYRMPAHFGPMPGPRQGPNGETFDWKSAPLRKTVSLSFLSDAAALDALLPPDLELAHEPEVTIEITSMTALEWLAGRGYSTFGVRFPARFKGRKDDVIGSFLSILWENLPDPILSGRDELGFSKLYCEIPPPRMFRDRTTYDAHWMGHHFFQMNVDSMAEVAPAVWASGLAGRRNDGLLHFKYVPRTGSSGEADISAITFTPNQGSQAVTDRVWRGRGSHRFLPSTWEQLPTMFHIVNALGSLPVKEYRDAWLIESHGGKDLSDQRTLV